MMSDTESAQPQPRTAACAAVAYYLDATLRDEPPPARRWKMPVERDQLPIGAYLLGHGYLKPVQLRHAIRLQHEQAQQGARPMLGDVLVRERLVSPRVLATMLAVQLVDRILFARTDLLTRLEERLILAERLSPVQAARTIQLQSWLRFKGVDCTMEELLLQQNLVTHADLAAMKQEDARAGAALG
jgi:hypothetical protein